MEASDIWLPAGVFVGTAIGAFIGYFRRGGERKTDPVFRAVGLELGTREQAVQLIEQVQALTDQVRRIADALTDKNTEGINDRLDQMAQTVERMLESRRAAHRPKRRKAGSPGPG